MSPDPAEWTFPELADVKSWLGLGASDAYDDDVLTESLDAAKMAQAMVVRYPTLTEGGDPICPPDLRTALFLRTQRYAARRNSPEGVVGLSGTGGDFVSARVPAGDSDVLRLEGPWLKIAVA